MKNKTKRYSIRRYLTLHVVAWTLAMTIIPAAWVYYDTAKEVEELFDASLAQSARVLHGMIGRDGIEKHHGSMLEALLNKEKDPHSIQHDYEKKISFQVIDDTGLILRSASAPDHPESDLERGYTYIELGQYEWRIFILYSKVDDWHLVVGERMDIRDELIHHIALDHAIPLFLLTPFFVLIVSLVIRKGLKPLEVIANDVQEKNYSSLEKLSYKTEPEEVSGLISAVNTLFDNLSEQYDRERRFSSDAAHELRTPLAALMIHTENILEDNNDITLDASIINIKRSINRLSHLVSQLLSLSRADTQLIADDFTDVDIIKTVEQVAADFKHLAEQKEQSLVYIVSNDNNEALPIRGNRALIYNMLCNVVTNAIKYSPENSSITITLNCAQKQITVEDSGPGIASALRERVKDRFYRAPGATGEGSGLGLAIVNRIADIHQIKWQLNAANAGGLVVEFNF
ncbi:ATP-binding protein [Colwellia psychrerythraea]|uniref:histidine kinase n=1 Tax=Colwellia psychrerythraea TaxID=28229 RepID=A0A099KVY7_COLPS|nr:ATP-binding protein [Colwellia psychrerythraea]KGJ94017.1 histidine kinase [Colwellia psychrerythraea]